MNGNAIAAVTMTFTAESSTRAFFAEDATAEAWEKSLSALTVYVFNSKGDLVVQRDFTVSELTAKSATFALPHATANTTCDFYAVANMSLSGIGTKSALLITTARSPRSARRPSAAGAL